MVEKGKKAKHEEQVQYTAYKNFCDETTVEKNRAIKEANELIDTLKADIQKYATDVELLEKEIAEHEADISTWNRDIKAATKVREIEKADYEATHLDHTESIDALERAIPVLKKSMKDVPQSFAQVSALKKLTLVPDDAKEAIDLMLSQYANTGLQPAANAYEPKSQGILDMLEKLLTKFTDELTDLEKEEMEGAHAFKMLMQDLQAQIDQATTARDEKAATKAKKLEAKATAEGDLQDTTATRDDDMKYLEDLTATCEQKASAFEERQKLRTEEIQAIEKAIEIIASEAVSGAAEEHLPALIETKASALVQLRADGKNTNLKRVADYLKRQGNKVNSRILSALALRVLADPFKKVRKMIKEMVTKLQEEAAEEADQKGFCDKELATNEATRKEKTELIEGLYAEIDELKATIAQLTEEMTELQSAVAALDAAVAQATKIREAEKAKNTKTISDAMEAQDAVAQALTVLKEFYAKAGKATALLQQPEIFDEPYKGMGGESGGVVGMLEVIQSDFARLEAETKAAEEDGQKEYDEFMSDSEMDKKQKNKDIEHKVKKKQDKSQSLEENEKDLEGTQKELDAALAYYDKLKPTCIDTGISYEERVQRREDEIKSLREALSILNGNE